MEPLLRGKIMGYDLYAVSRGLQWCPLGTWLEELISSSVSLEFYDDGEGIEHNLLF